MAAVARQAAREVAVMVEATEVTAAGSAVVVRAAGTAVQTRWGRVLWQLRRRRRRKWHGGTCGDGLGGGGLRGGGTGGDEGDGLDGGVPCGSLLIGGEEYDSRLSAAHGDARRKHAGMVTQAREQYTVQIS